MKESAFGREERGAYSIGEEEEEAIKVEGTTEEERCVGSFTSCEEEEQISGEEEGEQDGETEGDAEGEDCVPKADEEAEAGKASVVQEEGWEEKERQEEMLNKEEEEEEERIWTSVDKETGRDGDESVSIEHDEEEEEEEEEECAGPKLEEEEEEKQEA